MAVRNVKARLDMTFGGRWRQDELLAKYSFVRLGGPADYFVVAESAEELRNAAEIAWDGGVPLLVLGGASNVLISDKGFRGLVVLNRARDVYIHKTDCGAVINVESGTGLAGLARKCIYEGLAGLEWAVSIPGTVGGAVINNAGAFGGEMAQIVRSVDVLEPDGEDEWPLDRMGYGYRRSVLKGTREPYVLLSVTLWLKSGEPDELVAKANEFAVRRRKTQPGGPSLGSVFKNPPGDYAGRLIEAAGLKGYAVGGVMVSELHANFFISSDGATAADYLALLEHVKERVRAEFGIELEPEIELIGEW